MNYLLDVNILVAWGWSDHADHRRTVRWVVAAAHSRGTRLLTSPIPEIGFVRVSVQRSGGRISVAEASRVLAGMLETLGPSHRFLPDDCSGTLWPEWCHHAARITDAHLLQLAQLHGAKLATLDVSIPGAYVLPAAKG